MNAIAADPDHGTTGPAARARPSRIKPVEAVSRGSVAPGYVVYARRYQDATLHDRMASCGQLSDRQWAAACRVAEMHTEAGFEPSVTGSYAPRGWSHGHDDDAEEPEAVTNFRKLLGWCSEAHAAILHAMCLGQHPGVRYLATLQAALDDLARYWGISDADAADAWDKRA